VVGPGDRTRIHDHGSFDGLVCRGLGHHTLRTGYRCCAKPLFAAADLAHRAISLAQLSGNRFLLGIGAGSTEADFKAFERNFTHRFKRFNAMAPVLRDYLQQGSSGEVALSPWPTIRGRVTLLLGSWGAGVEQAAGQFDGWIASGQYRNPPEIHVALDRYRAAGGQRAIVSTIILNRKTDIGELRDLLQGFAAAGFDDAVVISSHRRHILTACER